MLVYFQSFKLPWSLRPSSSSVKWSVTVSAFLPMRDLGFQSLKLYCKVSLSIWNIKKDSEPTKIDLVGKTKRWMSNLRRNPWACTVQWLYIHLLTRHAWCTNPCPWNGLQPHAIYHPSKQPSALMLLEHLEDGPAIKDIVMKMRSMG
jgi:hypothetical protein